jgi:hypothetical protein
MSLHRYRQKNKNKYIYKRSNIKITVQTKQNKTH